MHLSVDTNGGIHAKKEPVLRTSQAQLAHFKFVLF